MDGVKLDGVKMNGVMLEGVTLEVVMGVMCTNRVMQRGVRSPRDLRCL